MTVSCKPTTVSLLPAGDWLAVLVDIDPDLTPSQTPVDMTPLVAWALVRHEIGCKHAFLPVVEDSLDEVVGLTVSDIGIDSVEDTGNMLGYLHASEEPYPWMLDEARRYRERHVVKRAQRGGTDG